MQYLDQYCIGAVNVLKDSALYILGLQLCLKQLAKIQDPAGYFN